MVAVVVVVVVVVVVLVVVVAVIFVVYLYISWRMSWVESWSSWRGKCSYTPRGWGGAIATPPARSWPRSPMTSVNCKKTIVKAGEGCFQHLLSSGGCRVIMSRSHLVERSFVVWNEHNSPSYESIFFMKLHNLIFFSWLAENSWQWYTKQTKLNGSLIVFGIYECICMILF